jgi:hypothetical protein
MVAITSFMDAPPQGGWQEHSTIFHPLEARRFLSRGFTGLANFLTGNIVLFIMKAYMCFIHIE